MTLLNTLGNREAILVDEVRNAGVHTTNFDKQRLSKGVYLIRMESPDGLKIHKLLKQ